MNFQDTLKTLSSLPFRSQLGFTVQVLARVFREVSDYNEQKQEKQTNEKIHFLRNTPKAEASKSVIELNVIRFLKQRMHPISMSLESIALSLSLCLSLGCIGS